jgi:uncharacterized protein YkwD
MKLLKITSAKKRSTVSKTIKLIIVLVLLNSTANASTKLYNKLNSLFNSDKAKCLEVSKQKIKKDTKDPAPYIFALKCELELYSLSDRDMFYESNPDIVKDFSNCTQRMCRYAKNIERLADKEIQCSSGYLVDAEKLCEIIKSVGIGVARCLPNKLQSFINNCKQINEISPEVSESGYSVGSSHSSDYGATRYNVDTTFYFNSIANGNEDVPSSSTAQERDFLAILNKARIEKGLNPLKLKYNLCRAARYHSYDMGTQGYFQHDSYDRRSECSGLERVSSCQERLVQFTGRGGGENIAGGNESAEATYKQWLNSPGHYKNMFSDRYEYIGIGYVKIAGSKLIYYWTTDFF